MSSITRVRAVLWASLLLAGSVHAQTGPAWRPLFNGKDLSGWKIIGKEKWVVDNGTIYGESVTPKGDGFLKTEKTYQDFHVFLRYKCETNTNSGLFYLKTAVGPTKPSIHPQLAKSWQLGSCHLLGEMRGS